jgi:hypothetical protein
MTRRGIIGAAAATVASAASEQEALRGTFLAYMGGKPVFIIALVQGDQLSLKFPMDGGEVSVKLPKVKL